MTTIKFNLSGRRFNYNGESFYLSNEVLEYIFNAAGDDISGICHATLGRRLMEKSNPALHLSDFPRDELRDLCCAATNHRHYHHIWWNAYNFYKVGKAAEAILRKCMVVVVR